jgi:hypothetical protein
MAKLKFGMVVTEASGKLGGHVFARNRGGAYARTKVTPVNPQTLAQQDARIRLAAFSQQWRGLTQEQRDAWNASVTDFGRTDIFGDLRNPTGKNLYTLLNINLLNAGQSPIDQPPLPSAVESFTIQSVSADLSALTFDVTFDSGTAGSTILVYATEGVSAGVAFVKNRYRLIGTLAGNAASPANVYTDYVAKFGIPAVGSKIFIAFRGVNNTTGQVSPLSAGSAIVQA